MNICQGTYEYPIYKVRVWTSASNYDTNVFVGKNQNDKNIDVILNKVSNKEQLKENEEQMLQKQFGNNFKNKLGLNTSGKIKFIKETIYNDDNINTLNKKISMYLLHDIPENDIFFWIEKEIKKTELFIEMVTSQILQGKKSANLKYVKEVLNFFLGQNQIITETDSNNNNKLYRDDIIELIKPLSILYVNEPLGVKYIHNQFSYYFQINPFKQKDKTEIISKDNFEVITDRSITIEHYQLRNNTINIALYESVLHENKDITILYFPFHDKKKTEKKDDIFKTIDIVHNEVAQKIKDLNDDDFTTECHINYLHLRFNESLSNPDFKLKQIFDKFLTTDIVPFVKYNTPSNKFYKVDKNSLNPKSKYRILKDDFDVWIESNPDDKRMKSIKEYLIFKVFIKTNTEQNKFASVILFPDSHIDIKYSMKSSDSISIDDISNNLKEINNLCDILIKNNDIKIDKIDHNFWYKTEGFTNIKIINIASNIILICKTSNSTLDNIKLLAQSLLPYVSVSEYQKNKENTLFLQYKRIDNFVKTDNITNFLNQHIFDSKETAIIKIREEFSISEDEALKSYEQWLVSQKVKLVPIGKGMDFRPANASNVMIKLFPNQLGYKALVEGITKIKYHKRIISLLKFLSYYGSKDNIKHITFIEKYELHKSDSSEYDSELFKDDETDNDDKLSHVGDVIGDLYSLVGDDVGDLGDFEGFTGFEEDEEGEGEVTKKTKKKNEEESDDNDESEEIMDEDKLIKDLKKNKTSQYVLNRLKSHDRKLFASKKDTPQYSTKCQWADGRQPIVISQEDKDRIDSLYPNSYDNNFIKYGTDAEKMKKNIYICPEIWCPISRVSMTYKEFVENGEKCPSKDIDEPVINMRSKLFTDKNTNERKPRYIGFTGDGNDCLPCCFAMKPEIKKLGPNKNQKKIDQCLGVDHKKEEDHTKNSLVIPKVLETYIVGTQYPINENRYGLMPKPLSEMFKNKKCGEKGEGTGNMIEGTDCFLRKGINHYDGQSFLSCMSSIFIENTDKTQDIIQLIKDNLAIELFLLLNDGNLCGLFINENKNIFDPAEFLAFRRWFTGDSNKVKIYIEKFNLYKVRKDIIDNSADGLTVFNRHKFKEFKHILREYIIYNSYHNFLNYLFDKDILKTHDMLLDLFTNELEWLNTKGTNIIVFEVGKDDITMACPFNTKIGLDLSRPFIFIVKQGDIYEQIVRVKQPNKNRSIIVNVSFRYGEIEVVDEIINYYKDNCKLAKNHNITNAMAVLEYLNMTGFKVRYQVINYNFKLEGFLLNKGIFIPCPNQPPVIMKNSHFIYIDEMLDKVQNTNYNTIKPILKALQEFTDDDFYTISKVVTDEDNDAVSLITKNGNAIPINKDFFPDEIYLDNLNIFIGWEEDDPRKIFIKHENTKELLYQVVKNEISRTLLNNKVIQNEVDFLRSDDNEFPTYLKKKKMDDLIHTFLKKIVIASNENDDDIISSYDNNIISCSSIRKNKCKGMCQWSEGPDGKGRCYLKIPQDWLDKFQSKLTDNMLKLKNIKTVKPSNINNKNITTQLVFDQTDVVSGKIIKIQEVLRDPYKFVDRVLEKYIKNIIIKDVKVVKKITIENLLTPQWYDLLTKFNKIFNGKQGYKIMEETKGFGINKMEIIRPDFIPLVFQLVSKLMNSHIKINEDIVKKLVENKLIEDHRYFTSINKINDFYEDMKLMNPTFAYYVKKNKSISLQDMVDIFRKTDYIMSEYELRILSNLLGIKVIIIARKNIARNPNEIKCIKPIKNTKQFIILFQTSIVPQEKEKAPFDKYELIIKNIKKPQFIFHDDEDIPIYNTDMKYNTLAEYIKGTCIKYYVLEEADIKENNS
jgi:hypothetical protein